MNDPWQGRESLLGAGGKFKTKLRLETKLLYLFQT